MTDSNEIQALQASLKGARRSAGELAGIVGRLEAADPHVEVGEADLDELRRLTHANALAAQALRGLVETMLRRRGKIQEAAVGESSTSRSTLRDDVRPPPDAENHYGLKRIVVPLRHAVVMQAGAAVSRRVPVGAILALRGGARLLLAKRGPAAVLAAGTLTSRRRRPVVTLDGRRRFRKGRTAKEQETEDAHDHSPRSHDSPPCPLSGRSVW